jgi:hypothetical protein
MVARVRAAEEKHDCPSILKLLVERERGELRLGFGVGEKTYDGVQSGASEKDAGAGKPLALYHNS